ncbi:hypothetical protein BN1708_019782, partial [Verticillium longisporum]
ARLPCAGP